MNEIEERVKALLRSPMGCAFLLVVEHTGFTPREVGIPINSFLIGAFASRDIELWRADRDDVLRSVFFRGQKLVDLARDLLESPDTRWWFEPLDINQQVWVSIDEMPPEPTQLVTPVDPPTRLERYSQKSDGALHTSSLVQGTSSIFAGLDLNVCDIDLVYGIPSTNYNYPKPYFEFGRLEVRESARIFEIDGPFAWHDLCVRYPADGTGERGHPDFSGDPGQIVPDWSAVSADWDAVHLTFGGLLTSNQVRIESSEGWSYHWGWEVEQTMWLRWMFTDSYHVGNHERENPLYDLVNPDYIMRQRQMQRRHNPEL